MDPTEYALAFTLTFAIEGCVAWPWLGSANDRWRLGVGFVGINAATHGVLWSAFGVVPLSYPASVALCETAVFMFEAVALATLGLGARRALGLSALCNLTSTLTGLSLAMS